MKKIAVFCGSSLGFDPVYKNAAIELGNHLIQNNIGMIYGGGKIGMMGILADTMIAQQGEVIGVIPKLLEHKEVIHSDVKEMIVCKKMSERKVIMSKLVDGYMILPGGFGTLDELFEVLTLGQLYIEQKPVGLLNINGFFNYILKQLDVMVKEGYLKQKNSDMLLVDSKISGLLKQMNNYKSPEITPVIHKVVSR